MRIYVDSNRHGHYIVSNDTNRKAKYIQFDYDYCGLALTFGWSPCDECNETDGTIECKHRTVIDMIQSASEYLDDCSNSGTSVEDPGYFDKD